MPTSFCPSVVPSLSRALSFRCLVSSFPLIVILHRTHEEFLRVGSVIKRRGRDEGAWNRR